MKKLFLILAVLVWTVPAFAVEGERVDFSVAYDNGTHVLTISYQMMDVTDPLNPVPKADGTNPVGIALRLNVDADPAGAGDVTTTGASGYQVASATGGDDFLIYLDYAWDQEENGDGYDLNEGHPLAKWIVEPGTDKGLPTLPAPKVALCMGHLRDSVADPDYSGPASDTIASVQLTAPDYGVVSTGVLAVDVDRGGVVGSPLDTNLDVDPMNPDVGIEFVIGAIPCFEEGYVDSGGQVVTDLDVARYDALPQYAKDCWCCTCYGSGDANCSCVTDTGDLYMLIDISTNAFFTPYAGNECADINYDGLLDTGDLYKMIDITTNSFFICPIPAPPCVPQ